jgi:hypothetical protein
MIALKNASMKISKSAWVWYLLGCAQEKLGQYTLAEISFKQAEELAPYSYLFRTVANKKKGVFGKLTNRLLDRLAGK